MIQTITVPLTVEKQLQELPLALERPREIPLKLEEELQEITLELEEELQEVPLELEEQSEELSLELETYIQAGGGEVQWYNGPYSFTPSREAQTIPINHLTARQNITIDPIPQQYGLITYNGSTITVS